MYYSGHGNKIDGSWVFKDANIAPHQIYELWKKYGNMRKRLVIISDSCFSGKWVRAFRNYEGNFII